MQESKENVLKYKLAYSGIILFVYLIGKNIPLYALDVSAYREAYFNVEELLLQSISGDAFRSSVFALGIFPSMISGFIVQIFMAIRGLFTKSGISPGKSRRMTVAVTLGIALFQAFTQVREIKFMASAQELPLVQAIAAAEMVTGAVLIMWMSDRNSRFGVSGRMVFITVNILERITGILFRQTLDRLAVPLMISAVMMFLMLIMENTEKRIPVQRISIHNIYADKNYMAIKLNPAGMMPMMFATAVFMLPKLIVSLLISFYPHHQGILWWQENLSLTKPFGILIYIVCEYLLTILFAMLMLNPKDISERFLKSGDSIVDLHAGRDTRRYLRGVVWRLSLIGATVMGGCIVTPMLLQAYGGMDSTLAALPTSMMMLIGFSCNMYRECVTYRNYDSCRPLF
ncbi:MAG: preprotein translocase subunit SecY [Ruminococcus sp.]|uniref:Preprotein translocase subunit SecY n=1 Tax=Schaedlerella arabinosiphila TaxID=2044587 RepID=A0A3R8JP03_9FIRM|nr:preprotein translocase subunit SecY [Schaedlerella arabinosiphila]MCI8722297.1 preprotein translocase subunit SecY [Ruminococcus sp.]RRK32715.1 preprotein translocase subunit SecY [Schaedlerella arabinosiphila]